MRRFVSAFTFGLIFISSICLTQGFAQPQPADPAAPAADEPTTETEPTEDEEEKLPKLADLKLPTAEELLRGPRRDWIVLKTDEVVICEPVYPRPATLERMQAKIDAYPSFKGVRTPEALAAYRQVFDDLHKLNIVLPGEDDAPEYRLDMKFIAEIRHHEDLMLRRVDVLINERKYRDAFEMLFVLERSHSGWPGYVNRRQRLLFLEAEDKFSKKKPEVALVTLEELHAANANYEGLRVRLGEVTEHLILDAIAADDYRRSRHFLLRLKNRDDNHAVVSKWTDSLLSKSTKALEDAKQRHETGDFSRAVDSIELSARIWPNMPGQPTTSNLVPTYNRIYNRYPRLHVGVTQLPRDLVNQTNVALPGIGRQISAAERRRAFLTQTTLFELEHSDDSPHYRSTLFEQWEPTDLGRRVRFVLRQNRANWETQPVVTASSIMSSFASRLDPQHKLYDERLAGFVSSVAVVSPFEFELQFDRVPARIESLLTFPVTRTLFHQVESNDGQLQPTTQLASTRFELSDLNGDRSVYRRSVAESPESNQFHVAEVVERLYPTYEKAVQGLLRGEVSMLPRVHSRDVPMLANDKRFQVVETAQPVTHLVQFNPRKRGTTIRELRRALAFAINREKILVETVLDDPAAARGRVVTGPFATRGLSFNDRGVRGYAYNTKVKPRRYDPALAAALYLAAAKHFDGNTPDLKLLCEADPVANDAAQQLVKHWGAAGIRVKLLNEQEGSAAAENDDWDLAYRIVRLTEPATQLWPLLTLEPTARVEALAFLPDWIRQELIELDRAGDWKSAVARLQQLHRHLTAEALLIPLWEVDDFLVFRQTIRGYPTVPMHPYQQIERWTVKPWLPNERPALAASNDER